LNWIFMLFFSPSLPIEIGLSRGVIVSTKFGPLNQRKGRHALISLKLETPLMARQAFDLLGSSLPIFFRSAKNLRLPHPFSPFNDADVACVALNRASDSTLTVLHGASFWFFTLEMDPCNLLLFIFSLSFDPRTRLRITLIPTPLKFYAFGASRILFFFCGQWYQEDPPPFLFPPSARTVSFFSPYFPPIHQGIS